MMYNEKQMVYSGELVQEKNIYLFPYLGRNPVNNYAFLVSPKPLTIQPSINWEDAEE